MSLNPDKTAVRVTASDCVFADRLFPPGSIAELPHSLAARWLSDGRALPAKLVRVQIDKPCFQGSAWHEIGEVLELEPHVAVRLHAHGDGTVIDASELDCDIPDRVTPEAAVDRWLRYFGQLGRTVKAIVIAKKGYFSGSAHHAENETILVPEERAILGLSVGALKLAPGERLTPPTGPDQIAIPPAA